MKRLVLPVVLAALMALVTAPAAEARPPDKGRLDVLFVGAHPDDEAGTLSTLGQWNEGQEGHRARVGVLTVTRGEGGGNAVGTEEGPPLGLLREGEERRAVGKAGITDVHYLDKVDFFYTVSTPLTAKAWDHKASLEKVVRLVRETRPKVIVTMEPAPLPGQHGNHQEAARLASEAYFAAADSKAFPGQLRGEGLRTWSPGRLFTTGGATGPTGPACMSGFTPSDPSAIVYGVWAGRASARNGGKTWAQVEREAQRLYVSQGWGGFPDVPTDPGQIGCDYFTQLHSRVPFTVGKRDAAAMLEGAVTPAGGLPASTEFSVTPSTFGVTRGRSFTVATRAPKGKVTLAAPQGWTVTRSGTGFTVTPPENAAYGRVRLVATLATPRGTGQNAATVEVRPAVTGVQEPLPRVSDFDAWAARTGLPATTGRVKRVLTLGTGQSRTVRVDLTNTARSAQSGTVTLDLPAGFSADPAAKPYSLAAGASGSVAFTVRNTGAAPQASDYTITTTNTAGPPDVHKAALELVPVAALAGAPAEPALDGKETAGEYPGPALDLSRVWEGAACDSAADCSATGKVTWTADALHFLVEVRDDKPGSVLGTDDCKRHWRTDSVEIAIDPRGDSENTSTTFKTGIFPAMSDGGPCFERDADAHQGPGPETAPGMRVAATVTQPYSGYTIEAKIPFKVLPATVDPARMGLNIFVYDSDTQDKTGQTRTGWSTFGGVQGDPYRWGLASLPGLAPPQVAATPPVLPTEAARSVNSPQSIIQAAATGVPLAAGPAAEARIIGRPAVSGGATTFRLRTTGAGTAHAHVWDGKVLGTKEVAIPRGGVHTITVPGTRGTLAVAFETSGGATASRVARLAP